MQTRERKDGFPFVIELQLTKIEDQSNISSRRIIFIGIILRWNSSLFVKSEAR